MDECPTYQTLRDGEPHEIQEEVFWHRDGHSIPVRYTSMPIYEDELLVGAVLTFRDISERVEVERQLLLAKDEADAANLAKSDFLSQMSHELRTPLNAILGFGQLLEIDGDTPLDETQRTAVRQILASGEHLLTLINEVLDLVVIESGKVPLSMEDVEPGAVIERSLVQSEALAATNGVRLVDRATRKDLPAIRSDATRFQQAMLNLISNAIKYNREGGTVTVDAVRNDDDFLRISVADTGMGIPDARRDDLFNPFTRLVARNSEIEGTGIGLTITKDLIELMGGRVDFESTEGEGSTFWIDLPLATGPRMGTRQTDAAMNSLDDNAWDAALGQRTILCVEDDPASLRLLEQMMNRVPTLTVIAADTAELALELADARRPDMILMDIDLPGMDGIEALVHLRQNPRTRDIPVVALSASAMPADVERGRAAGFRTYLTKPLNIGETLKTIRETIAGT
jgi:signal transduction histidine kinase/ActR/RegA family two-component response regulator